MVNIDVDYRYKEWIKWEERNLKNGFDCKSDVFIYIYIYSLLFMFNN